MGAEPGLQPAIEADGLGIRFPRASRAALHDVTFRVRPGARLLLAGPSGAGKSTLALTLNGLVPQSIRAEQRGAMRVFGQDTVDTPLGDLVRDVGMVFQDPDGQFCLERVEDEVAFVLENQGVDPSLIGAAVEAALVRAGLAGLGDRLLDTLSGGQKQRVALAAALVQQPRLLVLDEPTSNLDPAGTAEAFDALGSIPSSTTLVVIEHRLDEALALCDEVLVLADDGGVVAWGPARETFVASAARLAAMGAWLPEMLEARLALGLEPDAPQALLESRLSDQASRLDGEAEALREEIVREARGLAVGYGGGAVVQDASVAVHRGEVLALVGSNGSGKSTLLKGLAGLLEPLGGTVTGEPALMVFQNPEHQFLAGTVRDEVAWGLRARGDDPGAIVARVDAALDRFGLAELAEQHPYRLSQGQKRRLSVAALAVLEPAVLLADEPTFGLDRGAAVATMRWFRELAGQGSAVVLASHDLRLVAAFADRVAVVQDGRLVRQGPVADVLAWDGLPAALGTGPSGLTRWWLDRGRRPGLGPFLRTTILGAA